MTNTLKMVCPNGHEPVKNKEKSNDNWLVLVDPCPECDTDLEITYE